MVHHGGCGASLRRVCVGAFLALPHSCTSRWTGPSRILKKIPNKRSFVLWHIEEVWKSCAIKQIPSKTTVNGNSGTTTLNAAIHDAKLKLKSWKEFKRLSMKNHAKWKSDKHGWTVTERINVVSQTGYDERMRFVYKMCQSRERGESAQNCLVWFCLKESDGATKLPILVSLL
jgi:hypothetical protein